MLDSLTTKQKIIFFITISIMIIVILYYIYSALYKNDFSFSYENNNFIYNELIENTNNASISNFEKSEPNYIIVYVCGAVKENKVVTLKENSRVCDAIEAVGGFTNKADITNINLAYVLEDGEKIYVPEKGEELDHASTTSSSQTYSESLKNNKININKATQTELETIPGIGPSTAFNIIEYREQNGKFSNIEDIKNVSGIGNAKYEKIKNYITIK